MKIQVAKWGNSAAIRLPKAVLEQIGVAEGAEVDMVVENGVLVITPVQTEKPSLAELIRSMDEAGREGQSESVDWGPDRGSEIIEDDYSNGAAAATPGRAKRAS
jgi:antitoxin MazE